MGELISHMLYKLLTAQSRTGRPKRPHKRLKNISHFHIVRVICVTEFAYGVMIGIEGTRGFGGIAENSGLFVNNLGPN